MSRGQAVPRAKMPALDRSLDEDAEKGDVSEVARLIERGAKVNATDGYLQAPLHYAAWKGHLRVAELLAGKMEKVDIADKYKNTPLHYAAACGHAAMAELLLNMGADLHAQDKSKKTPLDYAKRQKGQKGADCVALLQGRSGEAERAHSGGDSTPSTAEELVQDVLFFGEDALTQEANAFADQHFQVFEASEDGEHRHEYMLLPQQFNEIVERSLNDHLAAKGVTPDTFYAALEERDEAGCASTSALVQFLRMTTDYHLFIQKLEERKQEALRADDVEAS